MKFKMSDLMIDLETLGQTPQCPVISLGAVFFDEKTKQLGPRFYACLDVNEQIKHGRRPDGDTLKWWMGQSGAAKKVFSEDAKPVTQVLNDFSLFYNANSIKSFVWGNGSTFDISIMEDIYRMYGVKIPWFFTKVMDQRTYKRFMGKGEKVQKSGVDHNALDDAVSQATYVLSHL